MPPPVELCLGMQNAPWLHDSQSDERRVEHLRRISETVFAGNQRPTVRLVPMDRATLMAQNAESARLALPRRPPPAKAAAQPTYMHVAPVLICASAVRGHSPHSAVVPRGWPHPVLTLQDSSYDLADAPRACRNLKSPGCPLLGEHSLRSKPPLPD